MDQKVLSPQEVSYATGMCLSNVYRLIKNGVISAARVGRKTLVPMSSIEQFITVERDPLIPASLMCHDPALSLQEAAAYLGGMHPVELRRLIRGREIAAIRRGDRGHYKIRLSELNRWLEANTVPARRLSVE